MVLEISSRKNCKVFKFEVEIAKIVEKQMKKFENNNFKNPTEKIGEVICSKGIQNYKEAVYLICKIENFLTEIISDTVTIFG
jgi:dissimilatory sulfite reductase (desulfoviridin) alpha/beta subunit